MVVVGSNKKAGKKRKKAKERKGDKREKREILYQKVRTEGSEGTGTFYDPMGIKMGPFSIKKVPFYI